ncbi:MAG: hypothetical protein ACE5PO_09510, partial [Candidatus Bathyarchaeia archaeon]
GLQIRFAPCSMVPTFVKPTLKEFLDFAVRQLAIVRAYVGRKIWLYGLIPLMFYAPLPLLGLVLTAYGLALGSVFIPAVMLTLAFPMGALRSYLRILTFTKFMTHHTRLLKRHLPSTIAVGVLVLWVMLYAAVKANFAKAVEWRDRTYALRYPVQRRV